MSLEVSDGALAGGKSGTDGKSGKSFILVLGIGFGLSF